ncbi:MAG: hypothetical protein WC273_07030 [Dehalococcoidia bacterium]
MHGILDLSGKSLRRGSSALFVTGLLAGGLLADPAYAATPSMSFTTPSHRAVAAQVSNTAPQYQSPTTGANLTVRTSGVTGSQSVRITTDRGDLVVGLDQSCPQGGKTVVTTAEANSLGTPAAIQLTFCASEIDPPGVVTITAQNIAAPQLQATTQLITMAGPPAALTATTTRTSITATVTDATGNRVADGTPVRYAIPLTSEAACATTVNGSARLTLTSTAVEVLTGSGLVGLTVDWNQTGIAATCDAPGTVKVSTVVLIPALLATPTPISAFASRPVYSSQKLAQVVFNGGSVAGLDAGLRTVGATGAWAQNAQGDFILYVVGGGFVNDPFKVAFPGGFPTATAMTLTGR